MSGSRDGEDPGAVANEPHEPFVVEQRGIHYIPTEQRDGSPIQLAWMWAGGLLNVVPVVFGGLLPVLGLSFAQSVIAVIVGNLTWAMVGLGSQAGPQAGTTVMMIARAPFGPKGSRPVGALSWLVLLGFEATFMIIIVQAGLALLDRVGVHESDAWKAAAIVVAGILIPIIALYGHATVVKVLGWLALPFAAVFAVLAIWVLPGTHLAALRTSAPFSLFLVGLSVVVGGSGLGFITQASDYSRYLPRSVSKQRLFWSTTLGGFIPEVLLMILGVAIGTRLAGRVDAVNGVPRLVAGWFAVVYLLVVIVQLIGANAFALYSSGVTLQAIGVRFKRWQCVFLDTAICVAATFVAVFSNRFDTLLSDFLLFSLVFEAPFATIFIVDWAIRRGRYRPHDLERPRGGIYWRRGGLHLPGVIAQAAGMLAVLMWIDTSVYAGPLANRTDGADLSWLFGIVVSGALYTALGWRAIRNEVAQPAAGRPHPAPRSGSSTNGNAVAVPVARGGNGEAV